MQLVIYLSVVFMSCSLTGAHVEWCKQLIAATMSNQNPGAITLDSAPRDYRVRVLVRVYTCIHSIHSSSHPSIHHRGVTVFMVCRLFMKGICFS